MQAGYSSVGRASDCRMLQQSDGPWFDSGWPDFPLLHGGAYRIFAFDILHEFRVVDEA